MRLIEKISLHNPPMFQVLMNTTYWRMSNQMRQRDVPTPLPLPLYATPPQSNTSEYWKPIRILPIPGTPLTGPQTVIINKLMMHAPAIVVRPQTVDLLVTEVMQLGMTATVAVETGTTMTLTTATPAMVPAMVATEAIMTLIEAPLPGTDVTTTPTMVTTEAIMTLTILFNRLPQSSEISSAERLLTAAVAVVTLMEITRIPPHRTHYQSLETLEGQLYQTSMILSDTILQGSHLGYHKRTGTKDRRIYDRAMHWILLVTRMCSEARTPFVLET